ncbi:hypothetical protein QN277_000508 [Acacia crassicarpa]|uniref:Uncharacterized protein n=1 Tax=Acacia crassicarpa TaxID=499986 RepID=A0AAE1N6B6_9FABA|nr:hypothetical protein QN277_000508 [Acacia crassicarpa]
MGTEVLRPQDCLIERIRQSPVSIYRQSYVNYNNHDKNYVPTSRSSRKPAKRPERSEKRRPVAVPSQTIPVRSVPRRSSSDDLSSSDKRRPVVPSQPIPVPSVPRKSSLDDMRMGRSSGITREKVTILRRGESLDSKIMSKALKNKEGDDLMTCSAQSIYAGSAFAVSPSPSALPLPFFLKKQPSAAVDDFATQGLRRLLRLE